MSKNRNYRQNNNPIDEGKVTEDVTEVEETVEPEETVEEVTESEEAAPKTVFGVVTDCVKLNVRKLPNANAEVVCRVNINSKLMIDESQSTTDWYKVFTSEGVEGYCMKQFINVR